MAKGISKNNRSRVKLIFNPISGNAEESPQQLVDILAEMRNYDILPEVFVVSPEKSAEEEVHNAIRDGIELIVVAGGDGTIDSIAGALVESSATLGIIPTGTRNNVAFNLGIPQDIAGAVALLRQGRRVKIDVGYVQAGTVNRWFVEAATLGLLSDLFPVADDIQHGNLTQIGNLLSTFISSTPSQLSVTLEKNHTLEVSAYMVLIANMPYLGPRFQIDPEVSWNDDLLDVFIFSDMTKLDLISYAMQSAVSPGEDGRVERYRVREIKIISEPAMPVLADGVPVEQGEVTAHVRSHALAVMAGMPGEAVGEQLDSPPVND